MYFIVDCGRIKKCINKYAYNAIMMINIKIREKVSKRS